MNRSLLPLNRSLLTLAHTSRYATASVSKETTYRVKEPTNTSIPQVCYLLSIGFFCHIHRSLLTLTHTSAHLEPSLANMKGMEMRKARMVVMAN
jgi:hypothetical protein